MFLIIALGGLACVTRGPFARAADEPMLNASPRLLTNRDLAPVGDASLGEALRLLRRQDLRRYRGREPLVFLDGHPSQWSDVESIPATDISTIQLLSPVEAATKYGPLSGVDAIVDVRRRHSP